MLKHDAGVLAYRGSGIVRWTTCVPSDVDLLRRHLAKRAQRSDGAMGVRMMGDGSEGAKSFEVRTCAGVCAQRRRLSLYFSIVLATTKHLIQVGM